MAEDKQKFQHYFVEPQLLTTLTDLLEKEKRNRLSSVMQQLVMGLPVELILQANPEIAHWVNQLLLLFDIPSTTKQVNANRQKLMQDALIVAQYDLLILVDKKAIAVNWRSDRNIPLPRQLENSWEAQLQLFLLAETEDIPSSSISLIYYFFDWEKSPKL